MASARRSLVEDGEASTDRRNGAPSIVGRAAVREGTQAHAVAATPDGPAWRGRPALGAPRADVSLALVVDLATPALGRHEIPEVLTELSTASLARGAARRARANEGRAGASIQPGARDLPVRVKAADLGGGAADRRPARDLAFGRDGRRESSVCDDPSIRVYGRLRHVNRRVQRGRSGFVRRAIGGRLRVRRGVGSPVGDGASASKDQRQRADVPRSWQRATSGRQARRVSHLRRHPAETGSKFRSQRSRLYRDGTTAPAGIASSRCTP